MKKVKFNTPFRKIARPNNMTVTGWLRSVTASFTDYYKSINVK